MKQKYIGKTCPYCKTRLTEEDDIVVCSACDMPHHLSCWQDNQGCTTFGCTGSIQHIFRNASEATTMPTAPQFAPRNSSLTPVQTVPAKPIPASNRPDVKGREKPIEILYESRDMVFMPDFPIVVENTAIILDRIKDKLFARCTFRSITDKAIKAVLIEIICQDVWGSTLGEAITHQYLDLRTKRGSNFGQTTPIELADKSVRKISVLVKKILFADGSITSGGNTAFTMTAPVLLSQHFKSKDLVDEYTRETTDKARFVPVVLDLYWRCTCGSVNNGSDDACHHCGCLKDNLIAVLNPELLHGNLVKYQAEKRAEEERTREAEERARAEQAERIRLAEEQTRIERECKAQEARIKTLERKKKRRKKAFVVMTISVIILALLGSGVVFWGLPYYNYTEACKALNDGEYDIAYQTFVELNGFMNSAEYANEALYQKAKYTLLGNKEFDKAYQIFRDLGDYKDSATMMNEVRYQEAKYLLSVEQFIESYQIFRDLGDYKDSATMMNEVRYQEAKHLLSMEQFDQSYKIFTELGDYEDSEVMAKETLYQKGLFLLDEEDFDAAINAFKRLLGYKDSQTMINEAKYLKASDYLEKKLYVQAVELFEEIRSYKNSSSMANAARYQYVLAHKNNKDTTTYKYLLTLKSAGYKDSSTIYKNLYAWKITVIGWSTGKNNTNYKTSLSRYSSIYCHIKLSGGTPGGSTELTYSGTRPNGWSYDGVFDDEWEDGWSGWVYWENGFTSSGTLYIYFYDEYNNLIGSSSVKIT